MPIELQWQNDKVVLDSNKAWQNVSSACGMCCMHVYVPKRQCLLRCHIIIPLAETIKQVQWIRSLQRNSGNREFKWSREGLVCRAGKITTWSLLFYLCSMLLAVAIGIALSYGINPGRDRPFTSTAANAKCLAKQASKVTSAATAPPSTPSANGHTGKSPCISIFTFATSPLTVFKTEGMGHWSKFIYSLNCTMRVDLP